MLLGAFFNVNDLLHSEDKISATLLLNKDHEIFKGHFPGQPVVPGVCMLQMIREILEQASKLKLMLKKAQQVKYLALIDPVQVPEIQVGIQYKVEGGGSVFATGRLFTGDLVFLKFKGEFLSHDHR